MTQKKRPHKKGSESNSLADTNLHAPEPLWTVSDVAKYLALTPDTIRSMARRDELPAVKVGRVWRFYRKEIERKFANL
jgi:excisionase family DNA binding protein